MKRSLKEGTNDINYYDLDSDYGLALGEHPKTEDEEVNQLSVEMCIRDRYRINHHRGNRGNHRVLRMPRRTEYGIQDVDKRQTECAASFSNSSPDKDCTGITSLLILAVTTTSLR